MNVKRYLSALFAKLFSATVSFERFAVVFFAEERFALLAGDRLKKSFERLKVVHLSKINIRKIK